jgi:hypothetical protein
MKMIKPMLAKNSKIRAIEVDSSAAREFNDKLQKRLESTVWTGCMSYYKQGAKNVGKVPFFKFRGGQT